MPERDATVLTAEPLIYDLGAHLLTIQSDQAVTIENQQIVVQLDSEEVYKLLCVLRELFK